VTSRCLCLNVNEVFRQSVERCIDKVEICDSWANKVNDFDIQRTVHRDVFL